MRSSTGNGSATMQQTREHTLKAFDQDLERLRALISQMGGFAEHVRRRPDYRAAEIGQNVRRERRHDRRIFDDEDSAFLKR